MTLHVIRIIDAFAARISEIESEAGVEAAALGQIDDDRAVRVRPRVSASSAPTTGCAYLVQSFLVRTPRNYVLPEPSHRRRVTAEAMCRIPRRAAEPVS